MMHEEYAWSYYFHFAEVKFRSSCRSSFKYICCFVLAVCIACEQLPWLCRMWRRGTTVLWSPGGICFQTSHAGGHRAAPGCLLVGRGSCSKRLRNSKRKAVAVWLSCSSPERDPDSCWDTRTRWDAMGMCCTVFRLLKQCSV